MAAIARIASLTLAAAAAITGLARAQIAEADERGPPDIRTQASARRTVQPDYATVSVQIHALGKTTLEAGTRLSAKVDSVRRALRALGVPHDSVWTSTEWGWWWRGRVETIPGQQVWHRPPPGAVGEGYSTQDTSYRVHDAVEIRIHEIAKVGPAIDALLAMGLTDISGPRFYATSTEAAREAALKEATAAARRQAAVMAEAGGLRLGPLLSLSAVPNNNNRFVEALQVRGQSISNGSEAAVTVPPQLPVEVTVSGRWAISAP